MHKNPDGWTHDIKSKKKKKKTKEMKSNKAPGIDNLTSDVMIFGGEESVKQQKGVFRFKRQKRYKLNRKKLRW